MLPALVVHVTSAPAILVRIALNCCLPPELRVVLVGETAIETESRGVTITCTAARVAGLCELVAVMVATVCADTGGAVNKPVLEIQPMLDVQVAELSRVFPAHASNCSVLPEFKAAFCGET